MPSSSKPPDRDTAEFGVFTYDPAEAADAGTRLDVWLTGQEPDLSRARWQDLIKNGAVRVNGATRKPNYAVQDGDCVVADIPPPEEVELIAEDIPLDVLFEDAHMIAVNKPPRLVVHPAPGHASGTLVNALLYHCGDLGGIGGELRPGIVHRLDQDTSGVIVAAKNEAAMNNLARQFKNRDTRKEYFALVLGTPDPADGTIETTIGRDPRNRQRMSTRAPNGRDAVTRYHVAEPAGPITAVDIAIETGRTHQIRVHMAHIGHPVVGDAVYGRRKPPALPVPPDRQMLHARRLTIAHPVTGERMTIEAPVPQDIQRVLEACREEEGFRGLGV